jgi:DNA-directed RNA polymerase alpha subunit
MTPLSILQFTTIRAMNLLTRNSVNTVEQLEAMTEDQLMAIRGISYATIQDIEQALSRWHQEAGR